MIKLFKMLRPFSAVLVAVVALLSLQALAELYLPTLMADIIDTGVIKGDTSYIWRVGGLMLAVAAGSMVCAVVSTFLSARVAVAFGRNLRRRVFRQVERFSLHEFDRLGTATLITRTTNDITQVQLVTLIMLRMMVTAPIMMVGGIIMAVSKDATLSLVLVVAVPGLIGVLTAIGLKGLPLFSVMQTKLDRLNLVLREHLTGIRVIRAFDRVEDEERRFREANLDLTATGIKVNQIMAFVIPALMLLMSLTSVAIVWFGGLRIDAGHMQVGDMMAFIQYAMLIMLSLVMASLMFVMIPRAQASANRINEVLATAPGINDPPRAAPGNGKRGHVEFRDVTFSYPGAERPALSHISFQAVPGQVTAIIGGTGAGKSTLISLIPRFYDVDSGQVLVDGLDVRELAQQDLRARIGFVPQQAILFTGSVADNIRQGKEAATDDEIRRAAETAQALEFISAMPDGFDAAITQGGSNVSGGQKQRLAIARALVRRPEIYVFDDSFSALDFRTDARLRAALRSETSDATLLIVAQRIGTVMDADQIIVLEDGEVAGLGSHRELLRSCAVYREIAFSQLSEEELTA